VIADEQHVALKRFAGEGAHGAPALQKMRDMVNNLVDVRCEVDHARATSIQLGTLPDLQKAESSLLVDLYFMGGDNRLGVSRINVRKTKDPKQNIPCVRWCTSPDRRASG
jgi:hypothetical protein